MYSNPYYGYGFGNQTYTGSNPQWEIARGKVISSENSHEVFRGNEILEVSVDDASRMDVASITLGQQQIRLQPGQRFPIRFQFYYDKSRAGPGHRGRLMSARISGTGGDLLFINQTSTEFVDNVKIDVSRVKKFF